MAKKAEKPDIRIANKEKQIVNIDKRLKKMAENKKQAVADKNDNKVANIDKRIARVTERKKKVQAKIKELKA